MEFPLPLRTAIEQKAQDSSTAELIREAQGLSQRYREESGQGKRLVTTDRQAFVYAAVPDARYLWRGSRGAGTHASLFGRRAHLSSGCRRRYRRRSRAADSCCRWNRFPAWNGSPLWPGWANH